MDMSYLQKNKMVYGEWRMANGKWRMANGEWRMLPTVFRLGLKVYTVFEL
jgi:hypothetical protein